MRRGRFRRMMTWVRLWLILRELRKVARKGPPLFALLLCGCGSAVPAPRIADEPIVVILRDGRPNCSGFAIDRNLVMTAAHCVHDDEPISFVTALQWRTQSASSTEAEVVSIDLVRDIAVLTSGLNFTTYVRLRGPRTGEAVFARSIWFGGTANGNVLEGAGFFRDTTLSIERGWSGSPVFAFDGRVVGLVHSCLVFDSTPRVCVPRSAAIAVLP